MSQMRRNGQIDMASSSEFPFTQTVTKPRNRLTDDNFHDGGVGLLRF
jgi:hypothetical protein